MEQIGLFHCRNMECIRMFNKIAYGEEGFDWDKLFNTINILENGFMNKAMQTFLEYPDLKDLDFRIWCLWYAGFTQEEIAFIFKYSVRKIQTSFANIRIAFGIGNRGDINKFVETKIKEKFPVNNSFALVSDDKSLKSHKRSSANMLN